MTQQIVCQEKNGILLFFLYFRRENVPIESHPYNEENVALLQRDLKIACSIFLDRASHPDCRGKVRRKFRIRVPGAEAEKSAC